MQTQPNFENFKAVLFNGIIHSYKNNHKVCEHLLLETVKGCFKQPLFGDNSRYKQFKIDFNTWLNNLDIRQVACIVEATKKDIKYPKYLIDKNYYLDYNKHDMLDIIKLINN